MSRLPKRYDFPLNGSNHSTIFFPISLDYHSVLSCIYSLFLERKIHQFKTNSDLFPVGFFMSKHNKKPSDT